MGKVAKLYDDLMGSFEYISSEVSFGLRHAQLTDSELLTLAIEEEALNLEKRMVRIALQELLAEFLEESTSDFQVTDLEILYVDHL